MENKHKVDRTSLKTSLQDGEHKSEESTPSAQQHQKHKHHVDRNNQKNQDQVDRKQWKNIHMMLKWQI